VVCASSRRWCREWDEASEGLLQALNDARPLDHSVESLITRRQRLTVANARGTGADRLSEPEQRVWLKRAVEREAEIRGAYERYRQIVTQSVDGFRTGARIRAAFSERAESRPTRLYRKV